MANSPAPVAKAANGTNKILLGLSVLTLIVGYVAGSMMSGGKAGTSIIGGSKSCSTEEAVKAELTKKLTDAGLIPPTMATMSMSGKVTAVKGNVLTIEVGNLNRNPLMAETPKLREVTVAEGTVIKMLEPMKAEEYQKAQEAFNKKQAAFMAAISKGENATPPMPPTSFNEVTLKIDEVKVDMVANVTAETDVREAASFTAKSVQMSEGATAGAPGLPGMIAPPPAPQAPTTNMPAPPAPAAPVAPGELPTPTAPTEPAP